MSGERDVDPAVKRFWSFIGQATLLLSFWAVLWATYGVFG